MLIQTRNTVVGLVGLKVKTVLFMLFVETTHEAAAADAAGIDPLSIDETSVDARDARHCAALLCQLRASLWSTGNLGASLLDFVTLIGFKRVNAAAFTCFVWRAQQRIAINFIQPLLGFAVCLILWWTLSTQSRILRAIWMAAGVAFGTSKTGGFGENLHGIDASPEVL